MKNKSIIGVSLLIGLVYSLYSYVFPESPAELAKEVCDCYKTAQSYNNTDKRFKKLEYCGRLMNDNLGTLNQRGVDRDWTTSEVENAQKEFDNAYDACNTIFK